jgi:hypothetical protein
MGKGEGERVSAELVKCWVEAMAYAQAATKHIWAPVLALGAIPPLMSEMSVREVMNAVESMKTMKLTGGGGGTGGSAASAGKGKEPAAKKTKWVKGGKSVDGPANKG